MVSAFFDSFASPNSMALILSVALLVLSAAVFVYRIASFLVSSVLLFLMLASGFAIAKNEIVSGWLDKALPPQEKAEVVAQVDHLFSLPVAIEPVQKVFYMVVNTLSNQKTEETPQNPPNP